jgi:lipid A 3-O-deacylase
MKRSSLVFLSLLFLFSCRKDSRDEPGAAMPPPDSGQSGVIRADSAHSLPQAAEFNTPQTVTKERRHHRKRTETLLPASEKIPDSVRIERIRQLRASGIEADWNEPSTRELILTSSENIPFASFITLAKDNLLRINFDNDILDNTDRFYTNGLRFDIVSPALGQNPVCRVLVPYRGKGMNYYGLSVVQNLYTPSSTKLNGIQYGDRPYAAYLYLSFFKITNDLSKKYRQTSELAIGVVGPWSFGDFIQKKFHSVVIDNTEPDGWTYQVHNDLVLNYNVAIEKGIYQAGKTDLQVTGTGQLGTLYTNLGAGLQFRAGLLNPYFANLGLAKKRVNTEQKLRKIQFFAFLKSSGKLIGYDATLQGGMLDTSSPYTVPGSSIERVVLNSSLGLTFVWNGIRIEAEQFLLSPEMKHGWWHKWVHLSFTFSL